MPTRTPLPAPLAVSAACLLIILSPASPALAGLFLTVAESQALGPRETEVIQGFALTGRAPDEGLDWSLDSQVGIDVGLGGGVQAGIGLPNIRAAKTGEGLAVGTCTVAGWALANLLDPETAPLGLALGGAAGRCDHRRTAGLDLILEKRLGAWTWVANTGFQREWAAGTAGERTTHLVARQGLGRAVRPSLALGLEAEAVWTRGAAGSLARSATLAGPVLALAGDSRWIACGWLFDLSPAADAGPSALQVQLGLVF